MVWSSFLPHKQGQERSHMAKAFSCLSSRSSCDCATLSTLCLDLFVPSVAFTGPTLLVLLKTKAIDLCLFLLQAKRNFSFNTARHLFFHSTTVPIFRSLVDALMRQLPGFFCFVLFLNLELNFYKKPWQLLLTDIGWITPGKWLSFMWFWFVVRRAVWARPSCRLISAVAWQAFW